MQDEGHVLSRHARDEVSVPGTALRPDVLDRQLANEGEGVDDVVAHDLGATGDRDAL